MLLSKNTRCTQHADANEGKAYPIYSTSKLHVTKLKTPDLKMSWGMESYLLSYNNFKF